MSLNKAKCDNARKKAQRPRRASRKQTALAYDTLEPKALLAGLTLGDSVVTFNELNYNPSSVDAGGEWIELHNQLSVDVELSGWRLAEGVDYQFAPGTTIGGGEYLIIAQNPAAFEAATGQNGVLGGYTGSLSNGGETLHLLDLNDRVMDELIYDDAGEWPVAADGSGATLSKIDEHLGTGDPNSWTFSSNIGGTPGSDNTFASNPLQLSEVGGATDGVFQVELHNTGSGSINLSGYSLVLDGSTQTSFALSGTIGANGYRSFSQFATGINPQDEDRLFLAGPGNSIDDGTRVENTARARSSELQGRWQRPDVTTFGSANSFDVEDAIVINEILYNQLSVDPEDGTVSTQRLINYDSTWRFNGTDQVGGWATSAHSDWESGQGLLGFETTPQALPEQIRTEFNPSGQITYYFESEFQFNGDLNEVTQLQLNHIVDDGAVFYLNGVELGRFGIDSGIVEPEDLADVVNNASEKSLNLFNTSALVVGTNRLSVEVHQSSTGSSDLVFGVELDVISDNSTAYGEDPEEWIELYNNSGSAVDLSGWEFADGVEFQFDTGTVLGAGQYLVVARDEGTLAAKYPGINIAGEFDGRLSNRGERIQLLDSIGNIADEVRYYDDGAWDSLADGGGASLELRDADADNSNGQAWAASDVTAGEWQTVSYTGVATDNGYGLNIYHEFVFGLLQAGEVLIDDISVIRNPGTSSATELIQDGTFSSSSSLATYRAGGNHRDASIVSDPDNASESVLRLVATGASEQLYNHVETTLANGAQIQVGTTYQISYRAKWISGSNQVNSRLYFNYLGNTERLERPNGVGTPGAVNSTVENNIGPAYSDLAQSVVTPASNQAVTISVNVDDPNGVSNVRLWYSVNEGTWQSRLASNPSGALYQATIPGFSAGTIVQFYVEGTDALGASSTFPADGADSRALYKVATSANSSKNSFQIITLQSEYDFLIAETNQASNQNIGATAVDETGKIYFDVQTRLRGASFSRNFSDRRGFTIGFNPEDKYRGVHDSVAVDRDILHEILFAHLLQSAGDIPSFYDDVIDVTLPGGDTSTATLKLARYNDVWADGQYENGSDGSIFDQDLIYTPQNTSSGDPEDLKDFFPVFLGGVGEPDFTSYGTSPEDYRDAYALENNRGADDFSTLIQFVSAFDLDGPALYSELDAIADIDQIARSFVGQSLGGKNDFVGRSLNHNIRVYENPETGLVQLLPWDLDSFAVSRLRFSDLWTEPSDSQINKLFDLPQVSRLMYGHADHLIQTTFNAAYAQKWADHYAAVQGEGDHNQEVDFVQERAEFILGTLPTLANYNITTNGGANFSVNDDFVTLQGTGSYKIRDFQIDGIDEAIDVTWLDGTTWQITVELVGGANNLTIRALDYFGDEIHNDSITVTAPINATVSTDNLRITEILYNPADPTASELAAGLDNNDDFEFIEIYNPSTTGAINLNGVQLVGGVEFDFGNVNLPAGERGVIVRNEAAFEARYGTGITVLGQYTGGLNNGGETVAISDSAGVEITSVTYNDGGLWSVAADGNGASLVLDSDNTSNELLGKYYSWRASVEFGGTPGAASVSPSGIVVNEIVAHTDLPDVDSIELFNPTDSNINIGGWFLSDSGDTPLQYQIPSSTILSAGGYLVFDQSDFDFALSSLGEEVYLTRSVNGLPAFEDVVEFGATFNGDSVGRLPDGSGRLTYMDSPSLGQANQSFGLADLIISEVHYNPLPPSGGQFGVGDNDIEFVEVYNRSNQAIDLSQWRLRGDVDFDFPAITLEPGQSIPVLAFDPADGLNSDKLDAFRDQYGISASVPLVGGFTGDLGNSFGRVSLQQADTPPASDPTITPWVTVDELVYDDLPPFENADNNGLSLHRISDSSFSNGASSWEAFPPTPGSVDLFVNGEVVGRHVFYNNSSFDANDPGSNSVDDFAISGKTALLPGLPATFANYTSYSKGINGLFIDIADLGSTRIDASDFNFAVGNSSVASGFQPLGIEPSITIRVGAGANGSDRVSLVFPDGSVTKTWLQVTVRATATTGLARDDVFYFGNVIGETGNASNAVVNLSDVSLTRTNQSGFGSVGIDSIYDYNRDGRVNLSDLSLARTNQSGFSSVQLITAPSGGPTSKTFSASSQVAVASVKSSTESLSGVDEVRSVSYALPAVAFDEEADEVEVVSTEEIEISSIKDIGSTVAQTETAERDSVFSSPSFFELSDFETQADEELTFDDLSQQRWAMYDELLN